MSKMKAGTSFPFAWKVYSPVKNKLGSDKNGHNLITHCDTRKAATHKPAGDTNSSFVWELKEKKNQIPNLLSGQPGI